MESEGMSPQTALQPGDLESLSRYVDGELPADESRALEARLRDNEALRSALVRLEELNHRLKDMLSEHNTVPDSVVALLDKTASDEPAPQDNVLAFPGNRTADAAVQRPRWAYAMAASLTAAVALSLVFSNGAQDSGGRLPGNDAIVSAALDSHPSSVDWSTLEDGREFQAVLSFPHEDGRWCREYLLRGGESNWRAVACRSEDRWVTQAAGLESFLDTTDGYRPAGAGDNATVAVFISQHAADIALGADEEQALIATRWSE